MEEIKKDLSESERFKQQYFKILQKVKERFKVKYAECIRISEPKASRVLNAKQLDPITLTKMASFVGYEIDLTLKERN